MSDKRDHPRQRTLKAGNIVFNGRKSVIDCTVRNLSATCARLQVTSVIGIPDVFILTFDERAGVPRHVAVSLRPWRAI